jgi:hypothetical protein
MDLPVRIAFGDVVEIDQRQRADCAARKRLNGPRPDTADADHRDMRALERGKRRCAIEPRDAAETPRAVGFNTRVAGSNIDRHGDVRG